ncbi:hypothetical protein X777_12864 [Ooceraea biroi]|uniref:Uncharacterized protein n=1 Tax=Ooceraea biroi TaxID=2015173 RepID=A0A026VZ24_OOCBI|nr:hypothetical protein X777_12864 [Ooceraea biroi]
MRFTLQFHVPGRGCERTTRNADGNEPLGRRRVFGEDSCGVQPFSLWFRFEGRSAKLLDNFQSKSRKCLRCQVRLLSPNYPRLKKVLPRR